MNTTHVARYASIVAVIAGLGWIGTAAAEHLDCSGSKVMKERKSYEVLRPGDREDRQMRQYVRIDTLRSKNPDIDGTEQTVFVHEDVLSLAGRHSGYGDFTLKSGEKLWYKFDGVSSVVRDGTAWEAKYQGVFAFVAGTGKYAAIRGGATYQGTVTPNGLSEYFVCSGEY